jgi:hypothetical protein
VLSLKTRSIVVSMHDTNQKVSVNMLPVLVKNDV